MPVRSGGRASERSTAPSISRTQSQTPAAG